jgi:adenylate cyclase
MEQRGLTFGPFQLNSANGTLLREGEPLHIGQRGIRLLDALLRRPGEVLTKAELLDAAWPDATIEEANLSVQIASLRKALGPAPGGNEWIETIPRVGYRFVPATDGSNDGVVAAAQVAPRSPGMRKAAAVAAVALAIVAAGFASMRFGEVAPASVGPENPALAVLPFDDMSGSSGPSYLGQGVSNDIISMLARIPDLPVVARSSSFAYKGRAVDVRQVGEELGATHVLEGSVRKEADRIRIVAQLVDAKTGQHVWAERFDRTGDDPWAIQDEVTERIVVTLAGHAGTLARTQYREAWGKDSATLQEYDYVLRANALIVHPDPVTHRQAMAILQEGVSRFPESGILKVSLAAAYVGRHARWWSDSPDPAEDFRQAAALVRGPLADPEASPMTRRLGHVVLAFANLTERKFDQALMEAEAAMALSPYDGAMIHWVGEVAVSVGRPELALEWVDRVAALYPRDDPRLPGLLSIRAWALVHEGKFEEALAVTSDTRGMLPQIHILRATILSALGRPEEAKKEIETLLTLDPSASQARFRQRFFYFDPEIIEGRIMHLAAAGLPEG